MQSNSSRYGLDSCANTVNVNTENIFIAEKLAPTGGSGATVYACYIDGWQCAMKEMDLSHASASDRENFEAEIKMTESLPPHKNVVRYLFHKKSSGVMRIFMTRYTGVLCQLINNKLAQASIFSLEEILKFSLDIIRGLEVLHSKQIIHRDIKSDNIFYTMDSTGGIAYLTIGDMDTARILSSKAKTIIGTPGYMAPEILSPSKEGYSFAVDVWSFGMVLYELMTLRRPYASESILTIATTVTNGLLPDLGDSVKNTYSPIIDFWKSTVSLHPQRRPTLEKCKQFVTSLLC